MDYLALPEISYQPLPGFQPALAAQCWLVLHQGQVVVGSEANSAYLWHSLDEFAGCYDHPAIVTGLLDGVPVGVVELTVLKAGMVCVSARSLLSVSETAYAHLSHSLQIISARREHAFCGCCGHPMQPRAGEWAMVCTQCGQFCYPRISPCIIVLVTRGDELLLVRHHRHGRESTMHTLVAGFIEPGESAEQAVHREVLEETGLTLGKLKYCFSQSWPFPHSLMMGFHGEYSSGKLAIDENELSFGGWFHRDNLPDLPPPFAIARKLVDLFL